MTLDRQGSTAPATQEQTSIAFGNAQLDTVQLGAARRTGVTMTSSRSESPPSAALGAMLLASGARRACASCQKLLLAHGSGQKTSRVIVLACEQLTE
jgi:hypothetical protein